MKVRNQFDFITEAREPKKRFENEDQYPDLTRPDNTPTLRQLVERSESAGLPLPQTGVPVYTGENPDLNVPFHIRKDKLAVSNFVKDRIHDAKESEEEARQTEQKIKAHKTKQEKAKKEKAEKDERDRIKKIMDEEKEKK